MKNFDQGDHEHQIAEKYWVDFSKLVAKTLKKVPEERRWEMLMVLQDKSSVYGSAYEDYL